MLEGKATFYDGDECHEAGSGTFVFLSRGMPHSYTFETDHQPWRRNGPSGRCLARGGYFKDHDPS